MARTALSTVQRVSYLMALQEQRAKTMATGQTPCPPAKVHASCLRKPAQYEKHKICVSSQDISQVIFLSIAGFPLINKCFTMSQTESSCFIQSNRSSLQGLCTQMPPPWVLRCMIFSFYYHLCWTHLEVSNCAKLEVFCWKYLIHFIGRLLFITLLWNATDLP